MSITEETRLESYIQRPQSQRCKFILNVLGNRQMTARQIARELFYSDLNAVKPRLTEMKEQGIVRVAGKAYDQTTKRHVALWEVVKDER